MSERGTKGTDTLVVALDGDKLGLIGGMFMAIVVMSICFYWRETDGATALVRTGWAFTAGYGCTFLIVRVILRTTLFELIEHERSKKPKGLKRAQGTSPVGVAGAMGDVDLNQLGLQPLMSRPEV